ncbi:MAG: hypothetical protein QM204_00450 [Bacillota bacterium]|jgi:hypothetical protein|nr:hypothetical protein [Bacillota bacterium]NLL26177.1 hypothetical protein [Erysipelotrichia bacterium]
MTENKKEYKDTVNQYNCLAGNCIIVAGVMKVAELVKGLFVKDDKKSIDCHSCKANCSARENEI